MLCQSVYYMHLNLRFLYKIRQMWYYSVYLFVKQVLIYYAILQMNASQFKIFLNIYTAK